MVRQDLEKHSGYLSLDIGSSDFCRSPSSGRMSKIVMGVCFFNPSLSLVEGIASEIYPSYSVPDLEAFHLDPYALSILRILQSSHSPCRFRDRSLGFLDSTGQTATTSIPAFLVGRKKDILHGIAEPLLPFVLTTGREAFILYLNKIIKYVSF